VPSIVADYRASAFIDVEHDSADRDAGRVLSMPVTVLQQDWGAALGFDAASLWRRWAPNLHHQTVSYGHFMAEEAPAEIARALRDLLSSTGQRYLRRRGRRIDRLWCKMASEGAKSWARRSWARWSPWTDSWPTTTTASGRCLTG
jgi:hypothetical protein